VHQTIDEMRRMLAKNEKHTFPMLYNGCDLRSPDKVKWRKQQRRMAYNKTIAAQLVKSGVTNA